MPALIEAMTDPMAGVRLAVVWTLGKIGPADVSAVPLLAAALKDPEAPVRFSAATVLTQIQAK